jgi:hypothetical protein
MNSESVWVERCMPFSLTSGSLIPFLDFLYQIYLAKQES